MKKIYLYIIALFGWQIAAIAQSIEMPRFIPPSPEVSAMFRYLDYPVSHSTGIPEISIPIYTIQSGSLSLPISISYHAGGRRYSDLTGAIGLGWNLNAGGTIARTVYGRPDGGERVLFSLKNANSLSLEKDYEYIAGFYYNLSDRFGDTKDSEYDLFSYSLPGGPSGYFVLTENGPFPLTLNAVKIEGWDNFIITDKEGNKYIFDIFNYTNYSDYVSCKTSWDLTSIISANGADTIKFSYGGAKINGNASQTYWGSMDEIITANDMKDGDYKNATMPPTMESSASQELSWSASRISEISFRGGKVIFDIHPTLGCVTGISIKDNNGNAIKKYALTQSYLDRTLMQNYKLDELSLVAGNAKTDTYKFEYNPTITNSWFYRNIDYWDYLNTNQGFLIPRFSINWCSYPVNNCSSAPYYIGDPGASRQPNENEMQRGVLKKITYPAGGSTEFFYEANRTKYINNTVLCGGLRIKQIKTTSAAGQDILRTFEYGNDGCGYLVLYPDILGAASENIIWNMQGEVGNGGASFGHYRKRVFSSGFSPAVAYYLNQPIFYGIVTEYLGDKNNNQGKIIYEYNYPYTNTSFGYLPLPNTKPTGFGNNILVGLNFYEPVYLSEWTRYHLYTTRFATLWKERNLSRKTEYAKDGNSYVKVKETAYNYQDKSGITLHGLKIYKYVQFPLDDYQHKSEELAAKELGCPVFLYGDVEINSGVELLTSVTETDYLSGGNVTVNKNFSYDPDYNLLTKTTLLNSNGDSIINDTYYPFQAGYLNTELTSRNMYAFPVKESRNTNGKIQSVINKYTNFGNNMVKLSKTSTQQGSYPEEKRIEYFNYDSKGNPLYIVKDTADQVVYLWGYKGQYPVAEIRNATYNNVRDALGGQAVVDRITNADVLSVSDSTLINNLRSNTNFKTALVTTCTYKPLVGIASMTDPHGVITKYDYDAFGRLIKVIEADKVIETSEYHYKN